MSHGERLAGDANPAYATALTSVLIACSPRCSLGSEKCPICRGVRSLRRLVFASCLAPACFVAARIATRAPEAAGPEANPAAQPVTNGYVPVVRRPP